MNLIEKHDIAEIIDEETLKRLVDEWFIKNGKIIPNYNVYGTLTISVHTGWNDNGNKS